MQDLIVSQRKRVFSDVSIDNRVVILTRLKESIDSHEEAIYSAFALDLNKSRQEVYMTELAPVLREIKHAIKGIRKWSQGRLRSLGFWLPFGCGRVVREPLGSILVISPWNYPFNLSMMPLVGALGAGNSVVLKPSSKTPNVAQVLSDICSSAFFKDEVYVIKHPENGHQLVDYKWDFIFFTGGYDVGREVASKAGDNLTPVCLELGGKSPVIVDSHCDIDKVAKRIAWGKVLNAGQTCIAPDYVIILRGDENYFMERIVRWMGDFTEQRENLVKIIDEAAFDRLSGLIKSNRKHIIYGGGSDRASLYIEPTIFLGFDKQSELMKQELFGMLLPIIVVDSLEEALEIVRSKDKPLAVYYFGNRLGAKKVKELSCGAVVINDVVVQAIGNGLPFGGVGGSGYGRYHGRYSFELFSHLKSIVNQPMWFDMQIKYAPYKSLSAIKKIMRF